MYLIYKFQKENDRRAYQCQLCSTIGKNLKAIQNHLATVHGRKKNYSCEICHLQFSSLKSKKRHIATVHEGKKNYSCNICHKQFGQLGNKKRHLSSGRCPGKPKVKPMKEVIEDIKNIQPVVQMNPIKIPKKVNASADNFCTSRL